MYVYVCMCVLPPLLSVSFCPCSSNAMGPYIAAKAVFDLPYLYGPTLLILILYLMTGTTAVL